MNVAADLLPQLLVLVALAERLVVDQGPVGPHARGGVHVVALGLADERVEHGPGEVAVARQPFQADDQGVLVGAVQRVARLEGDDALAALLAEQRPRLARRQDEVAVLRVLRLRQHAHLAADQVRPRVVQDHAAAGMVGALGVVDDAVVLRLVPRKDVRTTIVPTISPRSFLSGSADPVFSVLATVSSTGKASGMRPGVLLAVADDDFLVEHAVALRLRHRPGQRGEAAVADAVERRQVGVAKPAPPRCKAPVPEVGGLGRGHRSGNQLHPAVRGDQIGHRSNSFRMSNDTSYMS